MKFQYLGTAAAEGIPSMFCMCETCRRSREAGGRAARTRSQAIIDDRLLIDLNPDTYLHMLWNRLTFAPITDCLITHAHQDHLYAEELHMLEDGFSHLPDGYCLTLHGSAEVGRMVRPVLERALLRQKKCAFHTVSLYEPFRAGAYEVTALRGIHDPKSGPVIYLISDGTSTVLYAHDTHFLCDEVWDYLEKVRPQLSLVSLDCTEALSPMGYIGHMSLTENALCRKRLLEMGCAGESTLFVSNHFSHNGKGVFYDDFVPAAAKEVLLVSYDGMILHV